MPLLLIERNFADARRLNLPADVFIAVNEIRPEQFGAGQRAAV
jgi:hypothetical protein